MSRIMIIANCHAEPLAQTLAYNSINLEIDCIGLDSWFGNTNTKLNEILDFLGTSGVVISYNLSSQFGALESSELRSKLNDRFFTCTNIRFDGLHPDCMYIGPFGGRQQNFLSEYHSKIVVQSFASGRSISDCVELFNGKTYEKLGYYDIFSTSETKLKLQDQRCDIKFSESFFELIREEYCLLTINHPTSIVFHELIKSICKHIGVKFLGHHPWVFPNRLVHNVVWPIFNEIAESHGLKYRTPQLFCASQNGHYRQNSRSITIQDFVQKSYEYYATRLDPRAIKALGNTMIENGRFLEL